MGDYRAMFDRDYIGAWDLKGDVTVTISAVEPGSVVGDKGRKSRKPIIRFKGKEKALLGNKTNCKTIARLYGPETNEWIGKDITLYPTTTELSGDTVDCIRVRPNIPKARANGKAAPKSEPQEQMLMEPTDGPGIEEHDAREPD